MKIYTIGFTKRPARDFFETLAGAEVKRLIDVRTNNRSQLSGFSKKGDLEYFLERICGIDYIEEGSLAPRNELLKSYRSKDLTWDQYSERYTLDLKIQGVQHFLDPELFDHAVLLCSEDQPHYCHRRLAAEYLLQSWGRGEVVHL